MSSQLDIFGRKLWRPTKNKAKTQLSLTGDWLPWLEWARQTFGEPQAWTIAQNVQYGGEWFSVAWDETSNEWVRRGRENG